MFVVFFFFFQAEDGIRDLTVTGVQTCALPIFDCSRAIAMVNVAIDSHGSADFVIALHAAYGDRHVVDHAEALTMVREGVMKSAADVEGDSILQRILSRQDGPARR